MGKACQKWHKALGVLCVGKSSATYIKINRAHWALTSCPHLQKGKLPPEWQQVTSSCPKIQVIWTIWKIQCSWNLPPQMESYGVSFEQHCYCLSTKWGIHQFQMERWKLAHALLLCPSLLLCPKDRHPSVQNYLTRVLPGGRKLDNMPGLHNTPELYFYPIYLTDSFEIP